MFVFKMSKSVAFDIPLPQWWVWRPNKYNLYLKCNVTIWNNFPFTYCVSLWSFQISTKTALADGGPHSTCLHADLDKPSNEPAINVKIACLQTPPLELFSDPNIYFILTDYIPNTIFDIQLLKIALFASFK